mmetsp:Transcript_11483/g.47790  ORF Transcript_11483/g.47790 Transcript_11483/m.47790 type:complete len:91 (-) Transcript_11483:2108-2380(-)
MASRDAAVGQTSGADVRNSLYKRFDDRVNNIVTSLQNIVDAASIEDKATNAVGEYQVRRDGIKIFSVFSCFFWYPRRTSDWKVLPLTGRF